MYKKTKSIHRYFYFDLFRYFRSVLQLVNRVNSDLSNSLGNLFQRVVSMVVKNCNGKIPKKPLSEI